MAITVKTEELKKLLSIIANELNRSLPEKKIEIDADPYWYITTSEWAIMDKDIQPALGMLSEDWEFLKRVLNEEEPFSFSVVDKTSFLLRAISETIIPTKSE